MQVQGSFVHPLRMDHENDRVGQGFQHINTHAARFSARLFSNAKHLIAKLLLLAAKRLEAEQRVNGQGLPPAHKYATGGRTWPSARSDVKDSDVSYLAINSDTTR